MHRHSWRHETDAPNDAAPRWQCEGRPHEHGDRHDGLSMSPDRGGRPSGSMPAACTRRNAVQLGPLRRGAVPSRCRRRIRRTVVADTRMPSLRHSPTILRYHHRGFSRPSAPAARRSPDLSSARRCRSPERSSAGPPNSRCQRSSVAGVTSAHLRRKARSGRADDSMETRPRGGNRPDPCLAGQMGAWPSRVATAVPLRCRPPLWCLSAVRRQRQRPHHAPTTCSPGFEAERSGQWPTWRSRGRFGVPAWKR
jgi:hypothetical protein